MNEILLLFGIVIIICILIHRLTDRLGIPSLLAFLLLGMCFGENGLFHISFDNYAASDAICSASLIFIMFYGGFGTNFQEARSVAVKSTLLSTLGVLFTAGLVGVFCHSVLGLSWAEGMLIGSVISSTDAASVFSILRSKQLNLKDHTASMLEMESGSNDPMSYMLTLLWIAILSGENISVPTLLLKQILIGAGFGLILGKLTVFILNRCDFYIAQGNTIFLFALAILSFALPSALGGNGYLSAYFCGIYMGNCYLPKKRELVLFFDTLTGVAQMMIFFLLGLLVTPSQLPAVFLPSLLIMVFMTLIARPLSVSAILLPFGSSKGQIGLVSWAGLRGAASIVFAIQAVLSGVALTYNLFNLVFCIVLLSISLQGTLLAPCARKLHMIDASANVMKTFNDYRDESDISFVKVSVSQDHPWANQPLHAVQMPPELLVALILRDGTSLVPDGDTVLLPGDLLVIAGREFEDRENMTLYEVSIDKNHKWNGQSLRTLSLPKGTLVVVIQNQDGTVIPDGNTTIHANDTLVMARF